MKISPATIRYYEEIKVIPPIKHNTSGYRNFSNADLNWIYLVKTLREAGLSIESLQDFAALSQA
ncbi:transcriptional regulator, MerR family [Lactococcus fujiensis JCM 16395]|uniref:Transcriptional regulator, MerR family n=1 Tax=Lactococcus fujiensis JCM 16395 TaxID=1291764 RepID=A0A2A5RK01_9LACT|nr:transcriptional regulator, MerR family [Lactococcus fujiensis JCM 16395]